MARLFEEHMEPGEAERLENAVIDAALTVTALIRHREPEAKTVEATAVLYGACRELHKAREKAFTKSIGATWLGD